MESNRRVLLIGAALLSVLIVPLAGGIVAIVAMGQYRADLDITRLPQYFWFYRHNALVMSWLLKGCLGVMALLVSGLVLSMAAPKKLHGDARFAREREIRRAGLRADQGIVLGRTAFADLRFGGSEHILVEAPTRAGKGVSIVIPNLLEWSGSVVVLDIKRENWERSAGFRKACGQRVLLFDPFDPEGRTARYNPLGHIDRTNKVEVFDELQKIAQMLFPGDGSDPFWTESARTAFTGVGAYVAATCSQEVGERPFTFGEIYRQLTASDPQRRFAAIIESHARSGHPLSPGCTAALNDFTASSENTFAGIRQSVTAKLALWSNPLVDVATSSSDFDVRELKREPMSIYLCASPDRMDMVAPLYALMFQMMVDMNIRTLPAAGDQQLLLMLDEFPRLGRAPVLAGGFSILAGYGIRLMPIIQSRAQLAALYGEKGMLEIVTNCGAEILFAPKEQGTARGVSERLGNYTFKARSNSRRNGSFDAGSFSVSDQRRPIMLPQEVSLLPANRLIVLRSGIPAVLAHKRFYYKDWKLAAASAMPPPSLHARTMTFHSDAPPQTILENAEFDRLFDVAKKKLDATRSLPR